MGSRAKQLVTDNQGAAEKTMKLIAPLLAAPREFASDSLLRPTPHEITCSSATESLYGAVTRTRLSLYQRGTFHTTKLDRPVISVGNITTGGTGKTPLVEWVARTIAAHGKNVCILTRGYGRKDPHLQVIVSDGYGVLASPAEAGDEPYLLATKLIGTGGGDQQRRSHRGRPRSDQGLRN